MRLATSTLVIALAGMTLAVAATRDEGYANCGLQHLDMCHDSNQLFWTPTGGQKQEFRNALRDFLENAPAVYVGELSFTAASTAEEAMTGPGGPPVTLPTGEFFVSGFTPHFAPEMGATVFTPGGKIVLVALLTGSTTTPERRPDLSKHFLKVYAHNQAPAPELISYVRTWATTAVDHLNNYPGLPRDSFAGIQLWTRADTTKNWSRTTLP